MKPSKPLASPARRRAVDYHLDGLIEAGEAIKNYVESLRSASDHDLNKIADALSELEIEIYFHLRYHMKELRKPFKLLHDAAYRQLDEREAKNRGSKKRRKIPGKS